METNFVAALTSEQIGSSQRENVVLKISSKPEFINHIKKQTTMGWGSVYRRKADATSRLSTSVTGDDDTT